MTDEPKPSQPAESKDTNADSKVNAPEPDFTDAIQKTLGLLIPLSIITSGIGFLFTFRMISQQTTILSFESNPIEYIFFGMTVILASMAKHGTEFVAITVIFLLVMLGGLIQGYRTQKPRKPLTFERLLNIAGILYQGLIWVFAILLFAYGIKGAMEPDLFSAVTSSTPSRKSVIALIFKEDINPQVWHLVPEDNNPRRTKPLSLIFEYADSVLVRDLQTGAIVKISKDMLAGIADDSNFDPSKMPTATP